jgi:YgiT-type zinc finger domain-containing protein
MKCVICKTGEIHEGTVTVTLQRDNSIVVSKGVPADVCDNCGEYYLTPEVTERLLKRANRATADNTEIEVLQFAG